MKIKILGRLLVMALVLSVCSCAKKEDGDLEYALKHAGENRTELEHVLFHYSKDAKDNLKYRAAKYLIANMPFHYSYVMTDSIESYLDKIELAMDSFKNEPYQIRDSVYRELLVGYNTLHFKIIEDIKTIKADFLINNIEHSFRVWENEKWTQHLSFDEFCEFILPYKVFDGQLLDDWKELFFKKYNKVLSNLKYSSIYAHSSYTACNLINQTLRQELKPQLNSEARQPLIRMKTLLVIPSGSCDEYGIIARAVMIANGIPVGMDFTPQWPFRSLGHSWNFLHENTKKNVVFEGSNSTVGSPHKKDHVMAKVYRRTYIKNKELERVIRAMENVPRVFATPFIEDVTEEYLSTIDVQLNVKVDDKYVYLSVFNNRDWDIVAWGENKSGTAKFKNIGKDVLYLPVRYKDGGTEPIGNPFIVYLSDEIKIIKTDTSQKQKLKLNRKFPLLTDAYSSNKRKIGAKIQGASQSDFSDSVTFHVFDNMENDITINPDGKRYRYWRALSADGGHSSVAELKFYNREGDAEVRGEIIGTDGSFREGNLYRKEAAFDGDLLTFFDAPYESGDWIGMDFKDSVSINRVTLIMRGDGNEIEKGDEYELVYWTHGGWVPLGKQIADDIFLEFDNCPIGALFLLHNRTKGVEERIFTYENGKQVWW